MEHVKLFANKLGRIDNLQLNGPEWDIVGEGQIHMCGWPLISNFALSGQWVYFYNRKWRQD